MTRLALLALFVSASLGAQQPTSTKRIPVGKEKHEAPKPKPDTVRVPVVVIQHDTTHDVDTLPPKVVHETTTDTITHREWVPVPLPFPCYWGFCHGRKQVQFFASKPDTITRTVPGIVLPAVHDTVTLERIRTDTLIKLVPQFATDTLFLTKTHFDTVTKYLPGQIITVYRDTCDTPPVITTSTPEPGGFLLVGSGLVVLGVVTRKRGAK